MEFKDLPMQFQEMAANIVRSQLATLDLSTVEKETIDNISHNVRNSFIKLYEENLSSENKDDSPKHYLPSEPAAGRLRISTHYYVNR
nr:hypothetical protein [Escherichia coli]